MKANTTMKKIYLYIVPPHIHTHSRSKDYNDAVVVLMGVMIGMLMMIRII